MTGPQWGGPQYGSPPPYGPPPKSNTGLIAALSVVGVLVVAGLVVVLLVVLEDSSPPSAPPAPRAPVAGPAEPGEAAMTDAEVAEARARAEEYVAAVNAGDSSAATALTCDKQSPGAIYDYGSKYGPVRLVAEPGVVGAVHAVFNLEIQAGQPSSVEIRSPKFSGAGPWCVVG